MIIAVIDHVSCPDLFAHLCIVNEISIYVKISNLFVYLDVQFYDVLWRSYSGYLW